MYSQLQIAVLAITITGILSASGPALAGQQGGVTDSQLKVILSEWSMGFDAASADDGELEVTVSNQGTAEHNLTIESADGQVFAETPLLGPDGSRTLTVDLPDGSYAVYCNVPGHRKAGMEAKLSVGGAAEPEQESEERSGARGGYY